MPNLTTKYNTVIRKSIDDVIKRLKIDKTNFDHCLIICLNEKQKEK